MQGHELGRIGSWQSGSEAASFDEQGLAAAAHRVRETAYVVRESDRGRVGVAFAGSMTAPEAAGLPLLATLPPLYPEWLGDRSFLETHGLRFPYVAGAMANGIATPELVIAMGRAGMLGFFGAGGLSYRRIQEGLDAIQRGLQSGETWGANLIHAPHEPELEEATAALYIERGVRRVSASAYMRLTPAIVRYACSGLTATPDGTVNRTNYVFAKVSRPEVARQFMAPAPADMVNALVARGQLTAEEAALSQRVPVAEDYTVEADSGGHTDNRALPALLPLILRLRDAMAVEHAYTRPMRVGAAGGIGTAAAAASAFSMGAAYVLTGSINQSAIESGLSDVGRELLAAADMADVVMAPSPDMFELGVKVQVLRRGTLFAQRAAQLYDIYKTHDSLDAIDPAVRRKLEAQVFAAPISEVQAETESFWASRSPAELEKAQADPKHMMALVFRWYVGLSSRWAIAGDARRRLDYQIWCGPAMGAFNDWVRGTFLQKPGDRTAVQIALNVLEGAAVVTRAQQLRTHGAPMPAAAFDFRPRPLEAPAGSNGGR